MFFLPGNPGYQLYEDISFALLAVFCWLAVAFFAFQSRGGSWDLGRFSLIASFVFKSITFTLSPPTVGQAIAMALGTPNVTRLVYNITDGIAWCAAVVIALSYWRDPPGKRRLTARAWIAATTLVVAVMLAIWFSAPLPQTTVALSANLAGDRRIAIFLIIHVVALITGLVKIRSLCSRHAHQDQESWLERGLLLVRRGTDVYLIYAVVFLAGVGVQLFGAKIPFWHTVTVPFNVIAISLILLGFTLPATGPMVAAIRQRRTDISVHADLEPLWADLVQDNPAIALGDPSDQGIGYQLYRRLVEIRDGLTRLAPHITPPEPDDARNPPVGVAALQIRRALAAKHAEIDTDIPDGFSPLAGDNLDADLERSVRWLREVSRHYARLKDSSHPITSTA